MHRTGHRDGVTDVTESRIVKCLTSVELQESRRRKASEEDLEGDLSKVTPKL